MRVLAIVVLSVVVVSCVSTTPPITDPATKRAVTAEQVVTGANALERFAIDANHDGSLSDTVSIRIVKGVIDIDKAAKDAPVGWEPSVITLWSGLKNDLAKENVPARAKEAIQLFDNLVIILQGGNQ